MSASSFASSIIREPIHGRRTTCPVNGDTRLWLGSVKSVITNFLKAHELASTDSLPTYRACNSPGITLSIHEMVNALERAGGDSSLIDWEFDPAIHAIVSSWPSTLDVTPELELGFARDTDFAEVIDDYRAWYTT